MIQKNPAKLCLNSFWGKFGQRLNMRQTQLFHETESDKFFQFLSDRTKDVHDFHVISDDIIQLEWTTHHHTFIPENDNTNIYLATFTTCWARLKLYEVLDKLNDRVCYYDTDSVIYISRPGCYDPPLGDYLGQLTNELDGSGYIEKNLSAGPKNYSYMLTNSNDKDNKTVCKRIYVELYQQFTH